MAKTLLALLPVALLAILPGCEPAEHRYKPGDDALTRKIFEDALLKAGIHYQIDKEGFYVALDGQYQAMVELGKQVVDATNLASSLKADSGCAAAQLRQYLNQHDIGYAEYRREGSTWIQLTSADMAKHRIVERYAGFAISCCADRNTAAGPGAIRQPEGCAGG